MGIYRRGEIWWAKWKERGKPVRRSLGIRDESAARAWWAGHVLDRELEDDGYYANRVRQAQAAKRRAAEPRRAADPAPAARRMTVRRAADAWMKRVEIDHAGRETVTSYRANARRWQRRWGDLPIAELDRERLQEWRDARLEEVALRTVKSERWILLGFLKWCRTQGFVEAIPAVDPIKGAPRKRAKPAALEPEELETLLMVARDHPAAQVRALTPVLMLGAFAGLRRGEIAALEWGDVDLAEGFITIRAHGRFRPKSGEEREIPIGPRLAAYLKALREQRSTARWVAESPTLGAWVVGTMTRWARRLWQAAGVHDEGNAVLHGLRHFYATSLARSGVDVETVRELLGHGSVTTTEIYFSTTRDRKRQAVARLG
jgi:integrase